MEYSEQSPQPRTQDSDLETPVGQLHGLETHQMEMDSMHGLGADSYTTGTPASRIAAGAVGRRLDLAPPRFALHQPPSFDLGYPAAVEEAAGSSAFATPVMQQQQQRLYAATNGTEPLDWDYQTPPETGVPKPAMHMHHAEQDHEWSPAINSSLTPSRCLNGGLGHSNADGPPTPFGNQQNAIDQDFILNLNQEGDLEQLTRKAENDIKSAWKPLTMSALRKQIASLEDDDWMFATST
ncbi:hypothetical protein LPJ55_001321 [Coemansia sp. RSA 990]|nr:hypothetical protein LPJ79_001065 [Coemansia sp. RSA 1821]KAJ1874714.1 hypothetical protein LPJ55_001321 [Coemansia sp. RSA 990]KAJ2673679.1 hypothetical protein IWW42_002091 [Coemansia sp. RSA 1085]